MSDLFGPLNSPVIPRHKMQINKTNRSEAMSLNVCYLRLFGKSSNSKANEEEHRWRQRE